MITFKISGKPIELNSFEAEETSAMPEAAGGALAGAAGGDAAGAGEGKAAGVSGGAAAGIGAGAAQPGEGEGVCGGTASGTSAAKRGGEPAAHSPEVLERQSAMILSAMDAASEGRSLKPGIYTRRRGDAKRIRWRVLAQLRLFADGPGAEPWTIFSRDVEPRGMGFIAPDRLPLGYGGRLSVPTPAGGTIEVDVVLTRCRECYGGWYEGALYFSRPQPDFGRQVEMRG